MKKIQAGIFKITAVPVIIFAFFLHGYAAPTSYRLSTADSLFHAKQYTQSLEIYQSLFKDKQYSPSMLLKLAYIEEGLGHIAQSTYYLNLYYLNTYDDLALRKLEDVAAKNRLEGYADTDPVFLLSLMKQYYTPITISLAAVCIFLIALMIFQKFKLHVRPTTPATILLLVLAILFGHTWFNTHATQGITSSSSTYLMEGPSAGSSVVKIVGEGHRVMILGKKDIWVKIKWEGREVFILQQDLLNV